MTSLIKDYWEVITVFVSAIFGTGVAYQRQSGVNSKTASRIEELEQINESKATSCRQVMTKISCDERQDDCKAMQSVNHQHTVEGLARIEKQNETILNHLLSIKY